MSPDELKEFDYDIILVALFEDIKLCNYLETELLINTKNENKKVVPMIEPTLWYTIKFLLKK